MAKVPKPNPLAHARNHLGSYAAALWPPFELLPHLRLLAEHLEAVERGEIDRLMVFMPPRHGKSVLTSTLYPAWYLGRHTDRSIITSSYSQELSLDFGRGVRSFITDPLHRRIFPGCRIVDDNAAAHRLGISAGGNYYAVGAGGSITGRGADLAAD